MLSKQEFTPNELHLLSQAASGEAGQSDVFDDADIRTNTRFDGIARGFAMRPGLSMIYTELTARQDYRLTGAIQRSLNIIVTSGPGEFEVRFPSGAVSRASGDQTLLVSVPETAHLTGFASAGQSNQTLRLRVFPELLSDRDLAAEVNERLAKPRLEQFPYFTESSSMLTLLREPTGSSIVGQLAAESLALQLIARLFFVDTTNTTDPNNGLTSDDRAKLLRVHDMIVAEPASDCRLEDLSRAAGMSVSSFKAKFPLLFGQTPMAFFRELRLDRARIALAARELSVTEAATLAGYTHVSTFSTAFRRRFGIAPRDLQKNS
ncbi:MAG: AraC family transcriptional regulator [Myxococcota bacterium]